MSQDDATILYHAFTMLSFFLCIFGTILSDVWLGEFVTIVSLSIICAIGNVILSLGTIPTLNIPAELSMYIGLVLIRKWLIFNSENIYNNSSFITFKFEILKYRSW